MKYVVSTGLGLNGLSTHCFTSETVSEKTQQI